MKRPLLILALLIPFAASGDIARAGRVSRVRARVDKMAPPFTLPDIEGSRVSLGDYRGQYVVLEWTNMDCPFVRKHYDSGNMQALQEKYTKKGVIWLRVCSSAPGKQGYFKRSEVARRIEGEQAKQTTYLLDVKGTVGRSYGVKTTPTMFVINPLGTLIYAGAIDAKPSAEASDLEGATSYVSKALDDAMSGKEVRTKSTPPYGCHVRYAR